MIRTESIATGRVNGHIAHAERPRGGVLVLPTITAVDAPMRERARLLAEAGFTALVWDPIRARRRRPICRARRRGPSCSTTARSIR